MTKLLAFFLLLLALLATPARATTTIDPSDPGIYYSPGNWSVVRGSATAVNGGAYFKTELVNTKTVVLNFNVVNMYIYPSHLWWRIDGSQGVWTNALLTAGQFHGTGVVTLSLPKTTGPAWPRHMLEVVIQSTSTTANRWTNPLTTANSEAVILNGIVVDTGATAALPYVAPKKILVFGDSITEGYINVCAGTAGCGGTDVEQMDSLLTYGLQFRENLGAEVGLVGFASQSWNNPGTGNVPPFASAFNQIYAGASRSFSGLDMVVILHGQNGSPTSAAQVAGVLNGIAAGGFTGPIILLCPFNPTTCAAAQPTMIAGIAAAKNPAQSKFIPTAGIVTPSGCFSSVHPLGFCQVNYISPQLAALIRPYLHP